MRSRSTFEAATSTRSRKARLAWFLDRYGDEIEFDLASRTSYRLSMFEAGAESWETLLNCVEKLRRLRTSFLYEAMITDVDLYLESEGEESAPLPPPFIEETPEVSLLRTLVEQNQASHHYLAHQKGRPRVKALPIPRSARDEAIARNTRESFRQLEAAIKFVDQDQFERTLREHEGQAVNLDVDLHRGHRNSRPGPVDEGLPPRPGTGTPGLPPPGGGGG
jgi:hypothetical protein